jgi:hypothetical protein
VKKSAIRTQRQLAIQRRKKVAWLLATLVLLPIASLGIVQSISDIRQERLAAGVNYRFQPNGPFLRLAGSSVGILFCGGLIWRFFKHRHDASTFP